MAPARACDRLSTHYALREGTVMERLRRIVVAVVLGCCLLLSAQLAAPGASAGAQWCDTDPVVVIITPSGVLVPLFVNNGAQGVEHQPAVLLASMPYTVTPVD